MTSSSSRRAYSTAAAPPFAVSAPAAAAVAAAAKGDGNRQIGKQVELPSGRSSLAELNSSELDDVLHEVWRHGVVCIEGQQLSASEMVDLATRIGEPIVLPPCFFVGMRDPSLPQICRVGNLRPGAESAEDAAKSPELLLRGAAFGEYWHHDGNFYAPPRNAVLNTLHAKVAPSPL